ncbi:hypothetical protein ABW20_dc0110456 [Dactylellina cionopaga]|nr:hypothetical protein ABW20_dc0110456 [Dactylellina cionopaga]
MGQEIAVKLNGIHIIEPSSIKRQIGRYISATEETRIKRQLAFISAHPVQPYQDGRIEAYVPTLPDHITVPKIPESLWDNLPINITHRELLRIGQGASEPDEAGMELAAYALNNTGLGDSLLGYLKHSTFRGQLGSILTEALWELICSAGESYLCGRLPGHKRHRDFDYDICFSWCKRLVDYGANVNAWTRVWWDPPNPDYKLIHKAVDEGDYNGIQILLRLGADIDALSLSGLLPLDMAMWQLKPFVFTTLLTAGADKTNFWRRHEDEIDPEFAEAVRNNAIKQLVGIWEFRYRIESEGEEEQEEQEEQLGLFHSLVSFPSRSIVDEVMSFLIDTGSLTKEPLALGNDGKNIPGTALQFLALAGAPELLRYFFQNNPKMATSQLHTRGSQTPTPLQCALIPEQHEKTWHLRLESVKVLIEHGADPNEPVLNNLSRSTLHYGDAGKGNPPLYYAVKNANLEATRYLIEHGADIYANSTTSEDIRYVTEHIRYAKIDITETIVEYAVRLGRLDFVALFLHFDIRCREMAFNAATKHQQFSIAQWIKSKWIDGKGSFADTSDQDLSMIEWERNLITEVD